MQLNALFRTICILVHSGTTTFRQVVRETSRQPTQRAADRPHHALSRLLTERSLRHRKEQETLESESTAKGVGRIRYGGTMEATREERDRGGE